MLYYLIINKRMRMSKLFNIFLAVWLMVLSSSVLAKYETLDNGIVKFSVNELGSIGVGIKEDADGKKAWMIYDNADYVRPGYPFEMFSLKTTNTLLVSDSARMQAEENTSYTLTKVNSSILATAIKKNQFHIDHTYKVEGEMISIEVSIKNLSEQPQHFIYTRGIDMDPRADIDKKYYSSISKKGLKDGNKAFKKDDIIFTVPKVSPKKYPLALFVSPDEKTPHTSYILDYHKGNKGADCPGCFYDPNQLAKYSMDEFYGDGIIYMSFNLGMLKKNELKKFKFYYIFSKDIPNLIKNLPVVSKTKISTGSIKIKYKNTINYENVSTNSLVMNQIGGDPDKYLHKAFLKWSVGMMSSLPDGIKLEINGHSLSKNQKQIPFEFYYNKPIKFEILRNKDFRLPSEKTIELEVILDKRIVDKKEIQEKGELNTVKLTIKPIKRTITFKTNSPNNSTSILDLKNSEALEIEISADGKKIIDPDELKKFKLDIDLEGINYKLTKNENTHKVSLKLLPEFPLCRTQTGDININITVDKGFYPHDEGHYILNYHITDASSFWEKCKEFIIGVLIALLILWYLFGLIRRNKFCKRQAIVKEGVKDDDGFVLRRDSSYNLKKRVKFLQKLIPYRADRVKLDGIIYIASESCSSVYIAKNSQSSLKIDYQEIDKPGTKLKKIFNGTSLQDDQNNYILK